MPWIRCAFADVCTSNVVDGIWDCGRELKSKQIDKLIDNNSPMLNDASRTVLIGLVDPT